MEVGNRQIRLPIAIEIAHGNEYGITVHREVLCRLEGPITVAQQHGGGGEKMVGNDQIWLAIAIEIADSHEIRMGDPRISESMRCLEGAVAVAQQQREGSPVYVADCQVPLTFVV